MNDKHDEFDLAHYYYTPSLPSAFGGKKNLKQRLKKEKKLKLLDKSDYWLSGQDPYTLHKPITRKFPRRETIVAGPNQQLQADLIDVSTHAKDNDNTKFILTVIDVFSKKAWAIPIKNKSGSEVSKALGTVFVQSSPKYLQTDKGKEFLNSEVRGVLDRFKIEHFTSQNETIKASIVERFNKTLRNTLHRYFTKTGRERFIDVLKDFIDAYNNRYHTSLKMTPNEVSENNQEDVWYNLYDPLYAFQTPQPKLKRGDFVRISKAKTAFQRGFTPNWSVEVFIVEKVLSTTPITYSIKDYNGELIEGSFYEKELQKIQEPSVFKIEKVLQRKKIGNKNMVLVKWLDYPDQFNQWIPESDIIDI